MYGDGMEAAWRALHRIFAGLARVDRVTLSRFGSTVCHDVAALTASAASTLRRSAVATCMSIVPAASGRPP
jgi:hypothetical protein